MNDETPIESVNNRTKEDGKFLNILAREFPDISFDKVFRTAEQSPDSPSIVTEASDNEFTTLIKNVGQRSSLEKAAMTLRTSTQGKGIFIAGASIAAAALSLGYLVYKLKQRKEAKLSASPALPAPMREVETPQGAYASSNARKATPQPARPESKNSALQDGIAGFAKQAGVDPSLVNAAKGILSGEGLSLGNAAKAAATLTASQGDGKGGDNPLAALGNLLGGQGQKDGGDMLATVLNMFGGQNAGQGR